jgi:hypothetical protein
VSGLVAKAAVTSLPLLDSSVNLLSGVIADSLRLRRMEVAQGTIAGKVIAADDTPISSAVVTVAGATVAVQSAADGSFTLPPLPPGRYTLEARRVGYLPAKVEGVEATAGDTTFARLALKESSLQLSEVVVTGAAARSSAPLGFTVGGTAVGGACFSLNVDTGSDVAGIPFLPRRVRVRMEEVPTGAGQGGGGGLGPAARSAGSAASVPRVSGGTSSEPAAALPWQSIGADSIRATWTTDSDVITLRLRVRGTTVTGTATSNQTVPSRTAKLDGQKVACGGGR